MKKLKLIAAAVVLTMGALSCSSDDSNNQTVTCEDAAILTAIAGQAYIDATDAEYASKCIAYRTALQNQIQLCGDPSGSLQFMIDDLGDCTLTSNPGAITGVITVTAGSSVRTFETNITKELVGTTLQIRAEDNANSTDFIYFEIQQGQTGADVISNFNIHLISSDYNPLPDDEGGNFSSSITANSATEINGTFFGYVTSPTTGADIDLNNGSINIDLSN